jgi:hypothetical protein
MMDDAKLLADIVAMKAAVACMLTVQATQSGDRKEYFRKLHAAMNNMVVDQDEQGWLSAHSAIERAIDNLIELAS